jgi:hypothetical protein
LTSDQIERKQFKMLCRNKLLINDDAFRIPEIFQYKLSLQSSSPFFVVKRSKYLKRQELFDWNDNLAVLHVRQRAERLY